MEALERSNLVPPALGVPRVASGSSLALAMFQKTWSPPRRRVSLPVHCWMKS